jgi:hypothetical protein
MNQPSSPDLNLDEQLHQARLRTERYWFEDGVVELCIGGLFVLIGLYFVFASAIPQQGPGAAALAILFPLLFIGGFLATRRLIRKAKEGLVYPRTGYVSYARPSPRRRWLAAVLAAVIGMLTVELIKQAPSLEAWIPALWGFFAAGLLLLMGRRVRLARLSFLAFLSAFAGLGLSLRGLSTEAAGAIFYTVIGLAMAAGGAITLRRYMRQAPSPEKA